MKYESPKQIRTRQQRAENKASRGRQARTIKVMTDGECASACDAMLFRVNAQMWQRHADAAGRCARALIHLAIQRRAYQLVRDFQLLSALEAVKIARVELLGQEPA